MGRKKYWLLPLALILALILSFWLLKTPITGFYFSKRLKYNAAFSDIKVTSKEIYLKNFRIYNSFRSKTRYAFYADSIVINYSLKNFFIKPTVIESMIVNNIVLNIECSNPLCSKNNWTEIVQRIKIREANIKNNREVIIKKLTFNNLNANISNLGFEAKTKNTKVAKVDFLNVSSKKGFPTSELIAALFKSANLMDYLQGIIDQKKVIETIFKAFSINEEFEN